MLHVLGAVIVSLFALTFVLMSLGPYLMNPD